MVALSDSFRQMINDDTSDVGINVISLNAACDVVEEVIQFIYKGIVNIHAGNVESVFTQSINMQLHQLTHRCKKYMEENLSVDNFIQYHEHAMNLPYEPLYMITRVYIKNECVQLLPTENFAKLGIANLTSLLSYMNRFSSLSEHINLDIILQSRAAHDDCGPITELLNVIKFDELPIEYLESNKDLYHLLGQQHRMLIQTPLLMIYEEELTKQCEMLEKHQSHKKKANTAAKSSKSFFPRASGTTTATSTTILDTTSSGVSSPLPLSSTTSNKQQTNPLEYVLHICDPIPYLWC